MSVEDRLEVIRNRMSVEEFHFEYKNSEKGYRENVYTLLEQDVQYLFEQAERVQELEKANKESYWIASDFKFENLKLEQQNKRYREALEEITTRKMSTFLTTRDMSIHFIKTARKALEESE